MIWYKKILAYIFSGLLLGVGFLIPVTWPLGIIGASLLLYRLVVIKDSWQTKLFGSYLAMFVKFLFVLAFYWTMYPIEWLPFDFGSGEFAIIALYWLSVASFLACSGLALFGFIFGIEKIPASKWLSLYILIPVAWVFSEIFGSFTLSIFTLGPGSSPNADFSLGYVGYLLGEHNLLAHIARLGGVYALSLATILIAVVLVQFWFEWNKKQKFIIVGFSVLIVLTANLSLPSLVNNSESIEVALISTAMPVGDLFERKDLSLYRNSQKEAVEAALNADSDYILWPEDARYFSQLAGDMGSSVFAFVNAKENTVVIDSGIVKTEKGNVARAQIVDLVNKKNYIADKRYLVPQGEFMPYAYYALFHTVGLGDMAKKVSKAVSYVVGPETSQQNFGENIPGVLFCFESSDATGVRDLMNERGNVPFIAHPVSHVWFHEPKSFWSQLDTALRVQAIWNQVYIASAANHAQSKLFTPNGEIIYPDKVSSGQFWEVGTVSIPLK